jgi:diacylglycerol kinase family enzyme
LLTENDFDCTICEDIAKLPDLAAEALERKQLRAVVAAGGDGTVSLVLNNTPRNTPLLVLPLGTENLLSKYLELYADPAALARVISDGLAVKFDVGEANGKLFTLMAGCGFDADVVRRLHRNRRGKIHHLSYVRPILDSILNYSYPQLTVHYEHRDEAGIRSQKSVSGRWVFAVNVPRYAGGLNFAPQADPSDGLMDICVFEEGSLWSGLWYLGGIALGQHDAINGFLRVRASSLRIECEDCGPVPYQLDGDPGSELPLEIKVLPHRMKLLVSSSWVERQKSPEVSAAVRTILPEMT